MNGDIRHVAQLTGLTGDIADQNYNNHSVLHKTTEAYGWHYHETSTIGPVPENPEKIRKKSVTFLWREKFEISDVSTLHTVLKNPKKKCNLGKPYCFASKAKINAGFLQIEGPPERSEEKKTSILVFALFFQFLPTVLYSKQTPCLFKKYLFILKTQAQYCNSCMLL